jgi:CheY-like chemotaxis protein
VLIVQHEEPVRALIRRALDSDGYDLLEAGDAAEAVSAVASAGGSFDLVVADVTEPGITGPNGLMKRLPPRTRVLLLSLFGGGPLDSSDSANTVVVLQNPFRADALRGMVRELLAPPKK